MLDDVSSIRARSAPAWPAERWFDAVHPRDGLGRVSGLSIDDGRVRAYTWRREEVAASLGALTEGEAFLGMNRYHGPRGGDRPVAALNALWLDLDTYRVSSLAGLGRTEIADRIRSFVSRSGLPFPSCLVDSGRGFYCVWLIKSVSPKALPRWRAVMRALVTLAKPLGADPACVDPARVLRIPESWNEAAGRQVAVIGGDGARHDFETLADAIWRAAGRPDRAALSARRRTNAASGSIRPDTKKGPAAPRGLSRRESWRLKKADLDALLEHWGGLVPNGHRALWLHVHACAMAWIDPAADIADASVAKAASVAPGLDPREVRRVIAPAARRASRAANGSRTPDGKDPRYDYGGTRLAEIFDVDEDLAERLGLRQIIPPATRAERNGRRRVKRRRAAGALPRALWLALNPISREAPWLAEGVSRATWYRRRRRYREERLQARVRALFGGAAVIAGDFETGAATLYRGEAPPGATAPGPEPADHASDGPQDAHDGRNPPITTRQPRNATRPPQIQSVFQKRPADRVPERDLTQPPPKEIDIPAAILSQETLRAA